MNISAVKNFTMEMPIMIDNQILNIKLSKYII